jgi:penicillin-binding protein 2
MWSWEKLQRINTLAVIMAVMMLLLVGRLAWMQILQGPQYKKVAEENRTRQIVAQAPRGTIYDCNGAVLVSNRPSFAVSVIPAAYLHPQTEDPILAEITGVSPEEIEKMLNETEDAAYTPIRIKRDVNEAIIAEIEEHKAYLPGVIVEAVPVRYYPYRQMAAHVLGYMGSINKEEYAKRKGQGYRLNDLIGKAGVEKEWESTLKGVDGGLQIEVNAQGEQVQRIGSKSPVPGKSLVLTIDANLQKVAEEALRQQILVTRSIGQPAQGGCAVVLDVHNGAVLALASSPAFDPNLFAGGISIKDWDDLLKDPNRPLADKVIENTYPPGSVYKIVTLAAALDLGVANIDEIFDDKGVFHYDGWNFYGWDTAGLGELNLVDALAWSSDPVFYELGRRIGADRLAGYALTFGFGKKTGIALAGEKAGLVPTKEWKQQVFGEPWYAGETIIAAIGQGYDLVTPLQQAMLLMAVANNGKVFRPMVVNKIITPEGKLIKKYQPEVLETVNLRPEVWKTIKQGLEEVTAKGTAATAFRDFQPRVAGKTGSAETGSGTVHSWFACYAPSDNPEIAVAVLVEHGGDGAVSAVPVAKKIVSAYFDSRK